ncbi:hypothetical protein [Tuwongella immobilis]|uniref:DUF306 domain-containing protein n=1 Tax=Tuwongella immobilis TaxID=692036 RepID=A0A6C2YVT5_9BACT|nr:hypothetical protein [Tuwongella immobilis]VIP05554.1 unnamed protein product [Tuwongella immobilis]VTS08464.1 unnamed protein product [Tuwongella immobilis]
MRKFSVALACLLMGAFGALVLTPKSISAQSAASGGPENAVEVPKAAPEDAPADGADDDFSITLPLQEMILGNWALVKKDLKRVQADGGLMGMVMGAEGDCRIAFKNPRSKRIEFRSGNFEIIGCVIRLSLNPVDGDESDSTQLTSLLITNVTEEGNLTLSGEFLGETQPLTLIRR